MGTLSGDFIGFTFNNVHSSSLGILRVSNGSRLTESLLPTMQDKVVQVPGGDGSYYFGSYYTQKNFVVSIAFDSITEEQLRRMKQLFGDKKIHELVFDEVPYKAYQAKVTGMATINYICFDEGPTHRLYKGEGDIQFTAFNPYAICKNKYLDYYIKKDSEGHPIDKNGKVIDYGTPEQPNPDAKNQEVPIDNRSEWAVSSGMLETQGEYDKVKESQINLYNPGDISSDWCLKINFVKGILGTSIPQTTLSIGDKGLKIGEIEPMSNIIGKDEYVVIDSRNNLIEGYFTSKMGKKCKSGNVYNQSIIDGEFFKIPCNKLLPDGTYSTPILQIDNSSGIINNMDSSPISYNYYYL